MADECATEVAVQHADRSSAVPSASNGVWRDVQAPRRERSTSDAEITSGGLRDQVSGPSETTMSTPRVESIVRSLRVRLDGRLDFAVIVAEVEAELATYANARVTQFIPILVESRVWERLRRQVAA
jgi:hypothetical protein